MDGLIEPYLIKAISLLHSSAKDSGDQLKAMLDEAIRLKNETNSSVSKLPPPLTSMIKKDGKKKNDFFYDEDIPLSKRRKESPRSSQPSSPSIMEKNKESKRKHDIFNDEDVVIKRFKDSPRSSQPCSPSGSSPRHSRSGSPVGARKSDDLDSLIDADDLAQEIMDLHCVVCNGLDVTSGNQLVECQECHGLYHQECHQPNISDAEVNDPRSVFFCSECSKSLKKTASRPKSSSSRESPITFNKSRSDSPSSVSGKSSSNLMTSFNKQQMLPHKPGSSSGASSKSTSSSSSSSNSSASGNTNSMVSTSLISADKRLQNIKKRAATKLQEKRKSGK